MYHQSHGGDCYGGQLILQQAGKHWRRQRDEAVDGKHETDGRQTETSEIANSLCKTGCRGLSCLQQHNT